MTCFETQERISQFIDDDLPPDDRAGMFSHLSSCSECQRFLQESLHLRQSLKRTVAERAPVELERRIMERVGGRVAPRHAISDAWTVRLTAPLSAVMALGVILVVASMLFSPFLFSPSPDERRAGEDIRAMSAAARVHLSSAISPLEH